MIDISHKGVSGIYSIVSTIDDREYIGSSACLYGRMHQHRHYLSKGRHCNSKLQRFYDKYGIDSIRFEINEICAISDLIIREQYHIDTKAPLFNILQVAKSSFGYKHTAEVKRRLSESRKGIYPAHLKDTNSTPEARKKISDKARARGIPVACVDAAKKANTGRKHTKEYRHSLALTQSKIPLDQLWRVQEMLNTGIRQIDIAKKYGVSQRVISRVKNRAGIYGEIDEDYYEAAVKRYYDETAQQAMF